MYKEAKEVAKQFTDELNELLKKYKAIMEVEELPSRYACLRGEETIKVYIPADFREDGKCLAEYAEIDLGRYVCGD